MNTATQKTFIVDCPFCKAKVAALESGSAEQNEYDEISGQPYSLRVYSGNCPICQNVLVGLAEQIDFEGINAYEDRWSDIIRVYPLPTKTFYSNRIPKVVRDSLGEADRSLQAGANIAACVMLGRALEAVCRDVIYISTPPGLGDAEPTGKKIMLNEGIEKLRDLKVIDDRLYEWSQQLKAFRNLAAHPEDISISRDDASDLQIFVYAIVEYIYDLTDRYEEFKRRVAKRENTKKG